MITTRKRYILFGVKNKYSDISYNRIKVKLQNKLVK